MAKPKVAICWLGSCGGCDEAVVDINEVILGVANAVDLIFWPVALDFKYNSLKALKDGEIILRNYILDKPKRLCYTYTIT